MDKKDRVRYDKYLRTVADNMNLRDWDVGVGRVPADDGLNAQAHGAYGRKILTVYVAPDFLDRSKEGQRQTCVHELLHAHFNGVTQAMTTALNARKKNWLDTLDDQVRLALEFGIDATADIIASQMPLPPGKTSKKPRKASD